MEQMVRQERLFVLFSPVWLGLLGTLLFGPYYWWIYSEGSSSSLVLFLMLIPGIASTFLLAGAIPYICSLWLFLKKVDLDSTQTYLQNIKFLPLYFGCFAFAFYSLVGLLIADFSLLATIGIVSLATVFGMAIYYLYIGCWFMLEHVRGRLKGDPAPFSILSPK